MKFGLFYQLPCADWQSPQQRYRDTLDQIELADELGYSNAWLAELHFNPTFSITPSPLMLAAAAAQRTSKIRLGVAVNLLPLHNPIRLAEDIAALDLLSDGRAEFGVGRGSMATHFQGFNIPQAENRDRFIECLEFIIGAWTHEEFSYQGKYYSAEGLRLTPKPLQKPHPPVRIASNSSDTFEVVGQLGHHLFATPVIVPMPRLREGVKIYRETLTTGGHPTGGGELSLMVPLFVAGDAGQARRVPEASVLNYIDIVSASYRDRVMREVVATDARASETRSRFQDMTYDDWSSGVAMYGDPAYCRERLQALAEEFEPGEIICWFNIGGLIEHVKVTQAMKLFAEEVMPHFA